MPAQVVLDSNVLVAALRSRRGASFRILSSIGEGSFEINLSAPLLLEYEAAAKRAARAAGLTHQDIDDLLDYLCMVGNHHRIFFLWRPLLKDPDDDMVLELAVESRSEVIVTHNVRHFEGADRFGIQAVTPGRFLRLIGALP